jgi:K+-sensing histidine kinase KdpD
MRNFVESKNLLDKSTLFYLTATTTDGNYLYVNEKFATTFSRASTDFTGQSLYTSMHPNDKKKCHTIYTKCFGNTDKSFTLIIRKLNTAGTYVYTQWECKAMFENDAETPSGIYCIGYNISKYVANQSQLKEARKENIDKRAIIEEIIFQQSHLIRAPLTNIMGLTTAFLDEQLLQVDSSSTCAMILESTKQLDDIIRKIVKVSRS